MANIDKRDFYWNWKLAWAPNNLYYDLINVDLVHPPYATTNRNSSYFLKTRPGYIKSDTWKWVSSWYDVTDVKIIWDDKCSKEWWYAYALWKDWRNKRIYRARIDDWCMWEFDDVTSWVTQSWCWDWKLFTTNYVKWEHKNPEDVLQTTEYKKPSLGTWIQINKYELWRTTWLFSDDNIEMWWGVDKWFKDIDVWDYILVYQTNWWENDWFAWQVRYVTQFDKNWRIIVNAPWSWFEVITANEYEDIKQEWGEKTKSKWWVHYKVFKQWWEVIWYSDRKDIYIIPDDGKDISIKIYDWEWNTEDPADTYILWVADANDKVFVLTQNWYIHYSHSVGYDKFFVDRDMFAWVDKTSIVAYRDMVLAFGRRHIAVWVPDEQNNYWTIYNQSTSIGLRSRYSFAEYNWDLLFVSNDKRLLSLQVWGNVWRYALSQQDVWGLLNSKLSTLVDTDEVFVWNDNNNLKVFVQTRSTPYESSDKKTAQLIWKANADTHIYKYNTQFSVWTEDHVWFLLQWEKQWVVFWHDGLYIRRYSNREWWHNYDYDWKYQPFSSLVSAYLIENEDNWLSGSSNTQPSLFELAKLNRLVTTLWPWAYWDSEIKITYYKRWIWVEYSFPIYSESDSNKWIDLITKAYEFKSYSLENKCLLDIIDDSQTKYKIVDWKSNLHYHTEVQNRPRCDSYKEFLIQDHNVSVNNEMYELAPTMPLVTKLGEEMDYSTQIKLELIWNQDIICFWWWLAEMFVAPFWATWSDWEYELSAISDCSN